MSYSAEVNVMGDYRSGVVITATRASHLDPSGKLGPQSLVLTPAQAEALYYQMHLKKCQEPRS